MSKEITAREFYSKLSEDCFQFCLHWENESKKEKTEECWPNKMSIAEWDEQFSTYLESKEIDNPNG